MIKVVVWIVWICLKHFLLGLPYCDWGAFKGEFLNIVLLSSRGSIQPPSEHNTSSATAATSTTHHTGRHLATHHSPLTTLTDKLQSSWSLDKLLLLILLEDTGNNLFIPTRHPHKIIALTRQQQLLLSISRDGHKEGNLPDGHPQQPSPNWNGIPDRIEKHSQQRACKE